MYGPHDKSGQPTISHLAGQSDAWTTNGAPRDGHLEQRLPRLAPCGLRIHRELASDLHRIRCAR